MAASEKNEFLAVAAEFLENTLVKTEALAIILLLISLRLDAMKIEAGKIILSTTLITLAVIYFLIARLPVSTNYDKFILRLSYYSYSISIVGMTFVINAWPGGELPFEAGLIALFITLLAMIILDKVLKKVTIVHAADYIRTLVILILLGILYYLQIFNRNIS